MHAGDQPLAIRGPGDVPLRSPGEFTILGEAVYFTAFTDEDGMGLWRYDGSVASLVMPLNLGPAMQRIAAGLTHFGGALYFRAGDAESGVELWRFDGTNAAMVADIYAGPTSSQPGDYGASHYVVAGDAMYFPATSAEHGTEVWRYDGQTLVSAADVNPGPRSSEPASLTAAGDQVYFTADDGTHGRELWRIVSSPGVNPDLNGDQLVGLADLIRLQQNFGKVGAEAAGCDLDGDGIVGRGDVRLLASQFGRRPLGPGDIGVATIVQPAAAIVDAVLSERRVTNVEARGRAVRRPQRVAAETPMVVRTELSASGDDGSVERQTARARRRN
jgi:ELWxxDGT repeat protein